jgi:hypothetical protein
VKAMMPPKLTLQRLSERKINKKATIKLYQQMKPMKAIKVKSLRKK